LLPDERIAERTGAAGLAEVAGSPGRVGAIPRGAGGGDR
jgi:hypothetical protein